jgi:hypothetical protein
MEASFIPGGSESASEPANIPGQFFLSQLRLSQLCLSFNFVQKASSYSTDVMVEMQLNGIPKDAFTVLQRQALLEAIAYTCKWSPERIQLASNSALSDGSQTRIDISIKASAAQNAVVILKRFANFRADARHIQTVFLKKLKRESVGEDFAGVTIAVVSPPSIRSKRVETAETRMSGSVSVDGYKYARTLEVLLNPLHAVPVLIYFPMQATFQLTGLPFDSFQEKVQYLIIEELSQELGVNPRAIVITDFKFQAPEKLTIVVMVRCTKTEVGNVAFRLEVVHKQPNELMGKMHADLQTLGITTTKVGISAEGRLSIKTIGRNEASEPSEELDIDTVAAGDDGLSTHKNAAGSSRGSSGGAGAGVAIGVVLLTGIGVMAALRFQRARVERQAVVRQFEHAEESNLLDKVGGGGSEWAAASVGGPLYMQDGGIFSSDSATNSV